MVLLTSSAISVAISSSIVCTFTFLLFLSGYVLQQQTVRSLQESMHQPRERIPKPTLPAAFQTAAVLEINDGFPNAANEQSKVVDVVDVNLAVEATEEKSEPKEDIFKHDGPQTRLIQGDSPRLESEEKTSSDFSGLDKPFPPSRDSIPVYTPPPPASELFAYILPLLKLADLCSALHFSKTYLQHSTISPRAPIILLYPSFWESPIALPDPTAYGTALDLMRRAADSPSHAHIILHPVPINSIWSNPTVVESLLLVEVQAQRWSFERMLYLRSPGLAVDIPALDTALSTSDLRRSWASISSPSSSKISSTLTSSPPILLVSESRGILSPRGDMRRLTASGTTKHANHHENEMEVEAKAASKGAAWVTFDELELRHRRAEKEWYGGLVERFERGRREVCKDTQLLE